MERGVWVEEAHGAGRTENLADWTSAGEMGRRPSWLSSRFLESDGRRHRTRLEAVEFRVLNDERTSLVLDIIIVFLAISSS